jgi:glycine/D-amino acid oxidase-like deaminating enzyme
VVGAGAIGITTALTLQRVGFKVSIYAQNPPLLTRSARATGSWTPDSRIALRGAVNAQFEKEWRWLAGETFAAFRAYTLMASRPVEWVDRFVLSDNQPDPQRAEFDRQDSHGFFRCSSSPGDDSPSMRFIPRDQSSFPTPYAWRSRSLTFNIGILIPLLLEEFQRAGGHLEARTFANPADLSALRERFIVNCTGWGAHSLFGDKNLTPIRGQIAWLPAQPDVRYGLLYGDLRIVGRQDGIVVQHSGEGDDTGWNNASEAPNAEEASAGLRALASLQARVRERTRAVATLKGALNADNF